MGNKKTEDFPIEEESVRKFIKINKETFNVGDSRDTEKKEGYIFVNLSMVRMQVGWLVPKMLYAKGLSEKLHADVIVLTWKKNQLLTDFFESFGFQHMSIDDICSGDKGGFIYAGIKTSGFVLFNSEGEKLKKMNSLGINEGLAIYEDILRTSSLSTLRSCRNKTCIKKMMHLLWVFHAFNKILKKYKPLRLINDDMAYHENALVHLFINKGAKVNSVNSFNEVSVTIGDDGKVMRHGTIKGILYRKNFDSLTDKEVEKAEELLQERFSGNNGRDIDRVAFAGKKVYDREDICREYGIDPAKKTVVIMAHTFTDAVFNYGLYPYRDYYDWLENTLKIAGENDKVNWILKPHPARKAYHESDDSIEDMFDRLKKDNLFLLNDDVSAETVKNIADVLVTIGGNAGAEFACFGVPPIILGKPYYSGYGYTKEPSTLAEYKDLLMNIQSVEPLTQEQIITAKKVFYMAAFRFSLKKQAFSDDFSKLLNERYLKMCNTLKAQYFESNKGTEEYNTEIMDFITKYYTTNDIRKTEYYIRAINE